MQFKLVPSDVGHECFFFAYFSLMHTPAGNVKDYYYRELVRNQLF